MKDLNSLCSRYAKFLVIYYLVFFFFYTIFFIKDDNHTSTTAVVAQWVRTLAPQAEEWVFES